MGPAEQVVTGRVPADTAWACGIISRASLASGQAVRRLTLDQEIEGSNPSSPAKHDISVQACAEPPDVAVSTSLGPRTEEVRSGLRRPTTPRFVPLILRAHRALRLSL